MRKDLYAQWAKGKNKSPREPLFTFKEVAERLGITPPKLIAEFHAHPDHPKEAFPSAHCSNNHQRYYRWSEIRAWWLKHHPDTKIK